MFIVIRHDHRNGSDTYLVETDAPTELVNRLSDEALAEVFGVNYEEDKDEYLVCEAFDTPEFIPASAFVKARLLEA